MLAMSCVASSSSSKRRLRTSVHLADLALPPITPYLDSSCNLDWMGISRNGDDAMMMHMAKREERGAGLLKGHKKCKIRGNM